MKAALGLYTTLYSAPSSLFDRTLSLVYEPILSHLYNSPGSHIALYQSSQMIKYMKREKKEYRTLLQIITKRGDVEHLSGVWSESVLSLLPPKDRLSQIEKLTSEIKHEYGVLPTSAFFYGQVWHPYYISLLNNAGIESVMISSWNASCPSPVGSSFVMNELGKKVTLYIPSDEVSSIVEAYSEQRIDSEMLERELKDAFLKGGVFFLNMDQLVLGAVREKKGVRPGEIIASLLKEAETAGLADVPVASGGYLPQGWYGRDCRTYSLSAPNSLFVKNENFRYLYNRYISIAENLQTRNNRFLKKDVTTALFNTSMGNLFISDSEFSPMRFSSHAQFWRAITDAENCFLRDTESPSVREFDYEETGQNDYVMSSSGGYLAVISPKGASCPEFDYLPSGINFFDTRPACGDSGYSCALRKSFEETVVTESGTWNTGEIFFSPEFIDRKRTEIVFTPVSDTLPFIITKRYKMKTNTFTLDSTLQCEETASLTGTYSLFVYLSPPDSVLLLPEQRMDMVARGRVEAKTVKYWSKETGASLIFTSTEVFTLTEETEKTRRFTGLGDEEFVLSRKITFTFPLEVKAGESVTYRLNIRDISNK